MYCRDGEVLSGDLRPADAQVGIWWWLLSSGLFGCLLQAQQTLRVCAAEPLATVAYVDGVELPYDDTSWFEKDNPHSDPRLAVQALQYD